MKTQPLKGMRDLLPREQALRDYIQGQILATYRAAGFQRIPFNGWVFMLYSFMFAGAYALFLYYLIMIACPAHFVNLNSPY